MHAKIAVLSGDGIGPEVTQQAVRVLQLVAGERGHTFEFDPQPMGGIAIDQTGDPLPPSTITACKSSHAVLFGAIGGPKWTSAPRRPEQGLLELRKQLNLYANLRPVSIISNALLEASPIKASVVKGTDLVFVRELTGGSYFGARQEAKDTPGAKAFDTCEYSVEEIERVTRVAGRLAESRRKKILQVDKANVLATSRLWRSVSERIIRAEFPDVQLEHMLVDSASMHLIRKPTDLDVVLTENLFGDILTDEASMLPGSLGLLPSASLGDNNFGLYEPIHGSAPDIAGKGIANPIGAILSAAMLLRHSLGLEDEAFKIETAVRLALDHGARTADLMFAGHSSSATPLSTVQMADLIIEQLRPLLQRKVRAMTLAEKILCDHAVGLEKAEVTPGQMLCVKVDWTLASELTWVGMTKTFSEMERPKIWNNERFWLAIDHTVDPRINHLPKTKELIDESEKFAKEANIIDFYGPNQTILHTDFYRFRAQPGMLIVGADSHSPSAGGLGTFAIGLGAADVVMPLVTGETWLKVPETVRIEYTGTPRFGIGGKDVILYTMKKLKRNTVAFERAVEYTGNINKLSCDARFAIANMTAEFGGIAGIFEGDEITAAYIAKRPEPRHRNLSKYFRADPDAKYAATYEINMDEIDSLVALYPSPDNVVPVGEVAGMKLDGCFIGACTTAEEDLILAALVLQEGLKKGLVPSPQGHRRVTPGSVTIIAKLRRLGLIEIYEKAGFTVGAPGCSYCLGVAADKAGEGEVWLSSQNRNFKNRMGKGSIGNLASAATVAASSFDMTVQDPRALLDSINRERYEEMLEIWLAKGEPITVVDPHPELLSSSVATMDVDENVPAGLTDIYEGKVQLFEDNIDTDAIIPAEFMPGKDDTDLGTHCFEYVRPDFRQKVKEGFTITVAGIGFGCGSSREEAPRALKGCGVKVVIAKSFAFIYARNQPNMALLGITLTDERFYKLVKEGSVVRVDVAGRTIQVLDQPGGKELAHFAFDLSLMEERLLAGGGVVEMYKTHKGELFRKAMARGAKVAERTTGTKRKAEDDANCGSAQKTSDAGCSTGNELTW